MSGLSVSAVVNVSIVMSPLAAAVRNFGSLLILGASDVIDTTERIRVYTSITDIGADYGTSAPEYLAAALYFGQSPRPKQVYLGRWAKTATSGVLHGGVLSSGEQAIANFTAVTSGGLSITVDGTAKNLTGINLSAVTNLNGVASAVTTALSGSATVTWDNVSKRFAVESATTGTSSTLTYATAPGSGTDISSLMKLRTGQASAPVAGIAAEGLDACVNALIDKSNAWYGLYVAANSVNDSSYLAAAPIIEAAYPLRIMGVTITNTTALDGSSTTDLGYLLKAAGYRRTFTQYSANPHAAASLFGRAFTVDFTGQNTTITLKFKQEPGVTPETLTATQAAALKAKNINVFVNYDNDTAILQEGTMCNGFFFDEVHGLDWLQNDVQTDVYNLLYTSSTKVPQTDAGMNTILTRVEGRLAQAVNNGLLAPGIWNGPSFGGIKTGQYLTKGYYAYASPVDDQAQADREGRKATPIQAATKLAGAVHFSDVVINVNR